MTEPALGTILLVESDEALQSVLALALRDAGFEVQIADTAEEALAFVGDGPAPVVVTELGLLGESGLDLCRELVARDGDAAVIVMSGSEDARLCLLAMRAGAIDYVVKLWEDADDLVAVVKNARDKLLLRRARSAAASALTLQVEALQLSLFEIDRDLAVGTGSATASGAQAPTCRVLIVDDEPVTITAVGSLLSDSGYEVEGALSAEEALPRLTGGRFQMLLADKNLPGQSGVDLCRAAKGANPALMTVLMTGYGSLTSAVDAVDAGASAYLLKPFEDLDALVTKLDALRATHEASLRLEMERRRRHDLSRQRADAFLEACMPLCRDVKGAI